jgi:hypothetical protein
VQENNKKWETTEDIGVNTSKIWNTPSCGWVNGLVTAKNEPNYAPRYSVNIGVSNTPTYDNDGGNNSNESTK